MCFPKFLRTPFFQRKPSMAAYVYYFRKRLFKKLWLFSRAIKHVLVCFMALIFFYSPLKTLGKPNAFYIFRGIKKSRTWNGSTMLLTKCKISHSQAFFKIGSLENFEIFTVIKLRWNLLIIKMQAWRPETKKDSNTGVFLWILWNFWEHLFLQNTSGGCLCNC